MRRFTRFACIDWSGAAGERQPGIAVAACAAGDAAPQLIGAPGRWSRQAVLDWLIDRWDDHSTDAIITAAWLRRAAADPDLWTPAPPFSPTLAATEGWTFGVP